MPEWVKRIARLRPPVFIMGGFAEDALLGRGLDQPHQDLDLLVRREDLERFRAQMASGGVAEWAVALADPAGRPLLLQGHTPVESGGLEVEAYVAAREAGGGFSIEVPAPGAAGRLRLFLPPDTFDFPATAAGDVAIQTVSPLALCLLRAASAQTRHSGDKRNRDLAVLAQLRAAFLAGYDDRQLQPRTEAVAPG
jgi:hypothetical protein